jgi:dipeptidyl aminopeptidase/acylaminoacyl peptidase
VHSNQPPVLIIHGDADKLVPMQQASTFVDRCKQVNVTAALSVREGKQHGWAGMDKDQEELADWFDEHLRK